MHSGITPYLCQPKLGLTYIAIHPNQIKVSHHHCRFHNVCFVVSSSLFLSCKAELEVKCQAAKWADSLGSWQLTYLLHGSSDERLLLELLVALLYHDSDYFPWKKRNVIQLRGLRCQERWLWSPRWGDGTLGPHVTATLTLRRGFASESHKTDSSRNVNIVVLDFWISCHRAWL